jgi:hypothetical protein
VYPTGRKGGSEVTERTAVRVEREENARRISMCGVIKRERERAVIGSL